MNAPTAAETFQLRDELWETAQAVRRYRNHFGADTATAAKLDHLDLAFSTVTTELSMVARRQGLVQKDVTLIGLLPGEWVSDEEMGAFQARAEGLGVEVEVVNGGPGGVDYLVRGREQQVNMLLLSDHVKVSA